MTTARGLVDLSAVAPDELSADLELRVAATHGDQVLGSAVVAVDPKKRTAAFTVEFEPVVDEISHLPCGIRFIVGPNVGDRELLSLDVAATTFDFERAVDESGARKSRAAAVAARIDVGSIEVAAYLYRRWLVWCRTYTIRGRVVCRNWTYDPATRRWSWCDDPVPGAKVDIYDVDRFLWWYREDLVTTVTTEADGTFEATFVWCCPRWFPWWPPYWIVDDEILRRIRELLRERNVVLPPLPPDPGPLVLQQLVGELSAPEQAALSGIARRAPSLVSGSQQPMLSTSAETLRSLLPRADDLVALHIWPWYDRVDCSPDVVFRVRQDCRGETVVVHDESPAQTRWNIPTELDVTLLANDLACCVHWCRDPECPDCMKLTYVGCWIPEDQIGDENEIGPPDLRGYWLGGAANPDAPLFGRVRFRSRIGPDIDYVRVQYWRYDGTGSPTAPDPALPVTDPAWTDLPSPEFGGYSRRYWDPPNWSPDIPFAPASCTLGAGSVLVIPTRHHYEETHPGLPTFFGQVLWDDDDSLFEFVSNAIPSLGDGLFFFRFIGYAADASDELIAASERVIRTCGLSTPETMYLRIDNQTTGHPAVDHACGIPTIHDCHEDPEAYIRSLVKNEGLSSEESVDVCDIVSLEETDTLTVHFTATVPPNVLDGHLGGYEMDAVYGDSLTFAIGTAAPGSPCPSGPAGARGTFELDPPAVGVQVGPTYTQALLQGAPQPQWYGGTYKVLLRGCDFPECCAYQIGLRAWKRTTNGCQNPKWNHWNRYDNTFTILRRELCPDLCRDRGEDEEGRPR
jgi:hypothetical protein